MDGMSSKHWIPIIKSEIWRINWSLRTCFAVSIVTVFSLIPNTRIGLTWNGVHLIGPSFISFVTIIVKDINVGASVANGWSCIFGSLISSFLCWVVLSIFLVIFNEMEYIPRPLLASSVLVLAFIVQYADIPPMGKKLGVSMVALNLLSANSFSSANDVWYFLVDVIIGVVFAICGVSFPIPSPPLASSELEQRVDYCAHSIGQLLSDIVKAYQGQSQLHHHHHKHSGHHHLHHVTNNRNRIDPFIHHIHNNKHWHKLRLIINTIIVFKSFVNNYKKQNKYSPLGYYKAFNNNNKFIRLELFKYLEECLSAISNRNLDARFGPNRKAAVHRYGNFVKLIKEMLIIISIMEQRLETAEKSNEFKEIFHQFNKRPNFRRTLYALIHSISQALLALANTLSNQIEANVYYDAITQISHVLT
eukprot:gene15667-21192_t